MRARATDVWGSTESEKLWAGPPGLLWPQSMSRGYGKRGGADFVDLRYDKSERLPRLFAGSESMKQRGCGLHGCKGRKVIGGDKCRFVRPRRICH
jgi:hypothetical protein